MTPVGAKHHIYGCNVSFAAAAWATWYKLVFSKGGLDVEIIMAILHCATCGGGDRIIGAGGIEEHAARPSIEGL
jgi:hypothetical protein